MYAMGIFLIILLAVALSVPTLLDLRTVLTPVAEIMSQHPRLTTCYIFSIASYFISRLYYAFFHRFEVIGASNLVGNLLLLIFGHFSASDTITVDLPMRMLALPIREPASIRIDYTFTLQAGLLHCDTKAQSNTIWLNHFIGTPRGKDFLMGSLIPPSLRQIARQGQEEVRVGMEIYFELIPNNGRKSRLGLEEKPTIPTIDFSRCGRREKIAFVCEDIVVGLMLVSMILFGIQEKSMFAA